MSIQDNHNARLKYMGGNAEGRMQKGKLDSLKKSLFNSYQAETAILKDGRKFKCLINPSKLKADYDVLLKSLKNLDEKEQHLIRQCFFKNKSYRQYAKEVHLTYSQVMFIKRKALTKLQKQLLDNK